MQKEDSYDSLSWLTPEAKAQLRHLDKIAEEQDYVALFALSNNAQFATTLHQILVNKYDKGYPKLNHQELTLFLCIHLENSGQSASILSFLQEWFPQYMYQAAEALQEIEAPKSSQLISEAIKLLPADGNWFYDCADEKQIEALDKIDSQFSDYPDGPMNELYRRYANTHTDSIIGSTE